MRRAESNDKRVFEHVYVLASCGSLGLLSPACATSYAHCTLPSCLTPVQLSHLGFVHVYGVSATRSSSVARARKLRTPFFKQGVHRVNMFTRTPSGPCHRSRSDLQRTKSTKHVGAVMSVVLVTRRRQALVVKLASRPTSALAQLRPQAEAPSIHNTCVVDTAHSDAT